MGERGMDCSTTTTTGVWNPGEVWPVPVECFINNGMNSGATDAHLAMFGGGMIPPHFRHRFHPPPLPPSSHHLTHLANNLNVNVAIPPHSMVDQSNQVVDPNSNDPSVVNPGGSSDPSHIPHPQPTNIMSGDDDEEDDEDEDDEDDDELDQQQQQQHMSHAEQQHLVQCQQENIQNQQSQQQQQQPLMSLDSSQCHIVKENMSSRQQQHIHSANQSGMLPSIVPAIEIPAIEEEYNNNSRGPNSVNSSNEPPIMLTESQQQQDNNDPNSGFSVYGKMYFEGRVVLHLKQWTDSNGGNSLIANEMSSSSTNNFPSCAEQQQKRHNLIGCAVCRLKSPASQNNHKSQKEAHRHSVKGVLFTFEDCIIVELYPEQVASLNNTSNTLISNKPCHLHNNTTPADKENAIPIVPIPTYMNQQQISNPQHQIQHIHPNKRIIQQHHHLDLNNMNPTAANSQQQQQQQNKQSQQQQNIHHHHQHQQQQQHDHVQNPTTEVNSWWEEFESESNELKRVGGNGVIVSATSVSPGNENDSSSKQISIIDETNDHCCHHQVAKDQHHTNQGQQLNEFQQYKMTKCPNCSLPFNNTTTSSGDQPESHQCISSNQMEIDLSISSKHIQNINRNNNEESLDDDEEEEEESAQSVYSDNDEENQNEIISQEETPIPPLHPITTPTNDNILNNNNNAATTDPVDPVEDSVNLPLQRTNRLSSSKRKKYFCPLIECGRFFNAKKELKQHLEKVHSDDNPFLCIGCKRQFTEGCQLEKHKCSKKYVASTTNGSSNSKVKRRSKSKNNQHHHKILQKQKQKPVIERKLISYSSSYSSDDEDENEGEGEGEVRERSKLKIENEALSADKKEEMCLDSNEAEDNEDADENEENVPSEEEENEDIDEDEDEDGDGDEELELDGVEYEIDDDDQYNYKDGRSDKESAQLSNRKLKRNSNNRMSNELQNHDNISGTGKKQRRKLDKKSKNHRDLRNTTTTSKERKSSQCEKCGKSFQRRDKLMRHMFVHSEEKLFKCEICSKRFSRRDKLSDHLKSHGSVDEIHNCPKCEKKFLRPDILKQHIKLHEMKNKWQCTECLRFVTGKERLEKHMARHNEAAKLGSSLLCPLCTKYFIQRQSLKAHIKKFHPNSSIIVDNPQQQQRVVQSSNSSRSNSSSPSSSPSQNDNHTLITSNAIIATTSKAHSSVGGNCSGKRSSSSGNNIISESDHSSRAKSEIKSKSFNCPHQQCSRVFARKQAMKKHFKKHNSDEKQNTTTSSSLSNIQQNNTNRHSSSSSSTSSTPPINIQQHHSSLILPTNSQTPPPSTSLLSGQQQHNGSMIAAISSTSLQQANLTHHHHHHHALLSHGHIHGHGHSHGQVISPTTQQAMQHHAMMATQSYVLTYPPHYSYQ